MLQSSKYCRCCRSYTLHARPTKRIGFVAGALLTFLTLGLFLPVWILCALFPSPSGPWRCQHCGRKWSRLTWGGLLGLS